MIYFIFFVHGYAEITIKPMLNQVMYRS